MVVMKYREYIPPFKCTISTEFCRKGKCIKSSLVFDFMNWPRSVFNNNNNNTLYLKRVARNSYRNYFFFLLWAELFFFFLIITQVFFCLFILTNNKLNTSKKRQIREKLQKQKRNKTKTKKKKISHTSIERIAAKLIHLVPFSFSPYSFVSLFFSLSKRAQSKPNKTKKRCREDIYI